MIIVEKRKIELSLEEFEGEVIELCKLIKKHNSNVIGIGVKNLNEHFKLKLNTTDFFILSEQLNFKVKYGKFWYFEDIGV